MTFHVNIRICKQGLNKQGKICFTVAKAKEGRKAMKKLSLEEVLEGIENTRRGRSVWYPLQEVLFITLTAVICGATSYTKMEIFGKSKALF